MVASEKIAAGQANQRVTSFIPTVRLTPGRHSLRYNVKRFGQTPDPSAETSVYVKLTRPGGQDTQPGPGHSEFKFGLPQDIINNGVDADAAKDGVPVTIENYPEMAEGDCIKLSWGGYFVTHQVTDAEIGKPVVVTVPEATILAAGDSGANGLAVTFEVYDVVQNRSEDWSQEIRIIVDTGNSRLPTPFVKEAFNDVLDLEKLGASPATVQIIAMSTKNTLEELQNALGKKRRDLLTASMGNETLASVVALKADFSKGDKIIVRLTGSTEEGELIEYEAGEVIVDNLPHVYEIPIPAGTIRPLAKTQGIFSYRLIKTDGSEAKSKGAFIRIEGEAVRMAAPIAKDAAQGALDPDLANTRIEIPWDDSMGAGDRLTLKWIGTRPDFSIYDPLLPYHFISFGEAANKLPITITVPGAHLKAIEGGTLELHFLLEKDVNGTIVKRESLHAAQLTVGEPRAELPAPTVSGVVDGVMDPGLVSATLTVPNYSGKQTGDTITITWTGSQSGDYTDSINVNSFNKPDPIDFTIPGRVIAPNDGATVTASYKVVRTGGGRESFSDLTTFKVGEPVVLDPPSIISIKDASNNEIPADGSTVDTSVTVTGNAAANERVEIFDGAASKGKILVNASGVWTLVLSGLATGAHAIKAVAQYGSQPASAVRNFTVAASVAPTISSIKDTSNNEIPADGSTFDTSVTVTGNAAANRQVEIFDGAASKGKTFVNASGVWTLVLSGLAPGAHAIKAVAQYGSQPASAVRNFTVAASVAPTISSIKDTSNNEIPADGSTFDNSVTVTGNAAANRQVEIFDGAASKGKILVNASGVWTLVLSGLAPGAHAIKAVAQYGNQPASAVRNFRVSAVTAIAITLVKDSKGNAIGNGGTTTDTTLTVEGIVAFS
ncbi:MULTISPECIES: Ig-like domain repeat protein [unclassified Pseudomonas]|uniref:Ig-like domain repeat protein n=2 Tax=Pseudomonas TaxID=286 RepID=UPI0011BF8CDA|nr:MULTISPECIES: Ig-like domain repeat protein [unclassified Pseudomonas]